MREPRVVHLSLTPDQVRAALESTTSPRDRILIATAYFTAARASELKSLRIGDLDLETRTIFIHVWKSKAEDRYPITPELHRELKFWLGEYRMAVRRTHHRELLPSDRLIPGLQSRRYSSEFDIVNGVKKRRLTFGGLDPAIGVSEPQTIVRAALRAIGLPDDREGVHTLRRATARHTFDALNESRQYDNALRIVQSMLHHACAETTEKYLGLSTEIRQRDEFLRTAILLGSPVVVDVLA